MLRLTDAALQSTASLEQRWAALARSVDGTDGLDGAGAVPGCEAPKLKAA